MVAQTCAGLGYRSGTVTCTACQVDASGCANPRVQRVAVPDIGSGCLLGVNGALDCFGAFAPYAPSSDAFVDLAGSALVMCAIRAADSSLVCWSRTNPVAAPAGTFSRLERHGPYLFAFASDHFVRFDPYGTPSTYAGAVLDAASVYNLSAPVVIDGAGALSVPGFPAGTYRQLVLSDLLPSMLCALDTQDQLWCSNGGSSAVLQGSNLTAIAEPALADYTTLSGFSTLDANGRLGAWYTRPELRFTRLDGNSTDLVCGVTPEGEARCYGSTSRGQTASWRGRYAHLSASTARLCAQDSSGVLHCHGTDSPGIPANVARFSHDAWLDANDHLINRLFDWSSGVPQEYVPDGTYAELDDDYALTLGGGLLGFDPTSAPPPAGGPFHSFSAVSGAGCALDALGEAHCWGTGSMPIPSGPWDAVYVDAAIYFMRKDGTTVTGYVDGPWLGNSLGAPWVVQEGPWALTATGEVVKVGTTAPVASPGVGAHLVPTGHYAQAGCAFLPSTGQLDCFDGSGPVTVTNRSFVSQLPGSACFVDHDDILMCPPLGSLPRTYTHAVTVEWGSCEVASGTWTCEQPAYQSPVAIPPGPFLDGSLVAYGDVACALDSAHHPKCISNTGSVPSYSLPANLTFDKIAIGEGGLCGLTSTGEISCSAATPLSGSGFDEVAVFGTDICARRQADGALLCNSNPFFTPNPAGTFVHIEGRGSILCGQSADGSLQCWQQWPWRPLPTPPGAFTEFSVGGSYVCGLRPGGALECFGGEADLERR